MAADAVRSNAEGARLHGLLDDHLHGLNVVVCRGRQVVCATRSHDVPVITSNLSDFPSGDQVVVGIVCVWLRAESAVRDVASDVEREVAALDHVHELEHRLPGPLHSALRAQTVCQSESPWLEIKLWRRSSV